MSNVCFAGEGEVDVRSTTPKKIKKKNNDAIIGVKKKILDKINQKCKTCVCGGRETINSDKENLIVQESSHGAKKESMHEIVCNSAQSPVKNNTPGRSSHEEYYDVGIRRSEHDSKIHSSYDKVCKGTKSNKPDAASEGENILRWRSLLTSSPNIIYLKNNVYGRRFIKIHRSKMKRLNHKAKGNQIQVLNWMNVIERKGVNTSKILKRYKKCHGKKLVEK